jgi:hypothetical protein
MEHALKPTDNKRKGKKHLQTYSRRRRRRYIRNIYSQQRLV